MSGRTDRSRFMKSYLAAAVGCAGLVVGCGANEEDTFALVPVSGKVLLDGKPLEGATITFVSDPSNKPSTDGSDVTGAGGSFSAKYRNRAGLAVGKYKVVVGRPPDAPGGKAGAFSDPTNSPYMASLSAAAASKGGKALKPWPYGDSSSTPLSHEVSPKGDAGLEFDLKSSAK